MRAAIFNEPGSITVGERSDAAIVAPTDAVGRVMQAGVCGSDLWYHRGETPYEPGPIGHELIGIAEDVGEAYAAMDDRRAIKSPLRVGTI